MYFKKSVNYNTLYKINKKCFKYINYYKMLKFVK